MRGLLFDYASRVFEAQDDRCNWVNRHEEVMIEDDWRVGASVGSLRLTAIINTIQTMFNVRGYLRRRVHIKHAVNRLIVRIERHNSRVLYFWIMCLTTMVFGLFCDMMWGALLRYRQEAIYTVLPVFVLGAACYAIALAMGIWGAFGVEEVLIESGLLQWKRTALKWTQTNNIPVTDITRIRAITPWHRLDNTVEISTVRKHRCLGDKLLRDEALELAKHLRHAVGLTE